MNAILKCRTAALGGHLRVCDACGRVQLVFNPCHNRNCPKCGAWEQAQWLAQQAARLLPMPHFHVVFTLDHRVNPLAAVNPEAIYDLLFSTANQTLKAFAQQYLGGEIGVTAVLHTWGQTLQHHIHPSTALRTGSALHGDGRRVGADQTGLPLAQERPRFSRASGGALAAVPRRLLPGVAARAAAGGATAGGAVRRPGRGGAGAGHAGQKMGSLHRQAAHAP